MGVQNQNGALYWATGIDNSGLVQDSEEAKQIISKMGGSIKDTAQKTTSDIESIGKSAIESAKAQILEQKNIIKQIESDIKNIEKQASQAAPGNAKSGLLQEVGSAKQALAEEKAVLAGLEQQVNSVADTHARLRTRVMEAKEALSQMEMEGKRGTPEFEAQRKVLGELNDQYKDTAQQATILANDQRGFAAVAQAVSGVSGAMSAGVGIASLFGAENENLAKVQARLQAVMAITIGLQQVAQTLDKDSYFSVVLVTKAKELYSAANLRVATTLGISTAAANAFMIAITGGLIIAVTAAIAAFAYFSDKQEKAAKSSKEFGDKMSESISKPMVQIQSLSDQWSKLGDNLVEKKKFVDDNKDSFKALGVEVNNVADAENVLVTNKAAFIESLIAKAKAAAGMELASEKYKEAMKKMLEADKMANTVDVYTSGGQSLTGGGTISKSTVKNKAKEDLKKEHDDLLKEGDSFIKEADKQTKKSDEILAGANIDKYVDDKKEKRAKAIKEQYNAEKALQSLLLDINTQTSKLLMDQQEDSLAKRLAQIEAEKQAEIQKITDKEVSIVEAYNKSHKGDKGFKALSTKPGDVSASVNSIDPTIGKSLQDATTGVVNAYGQKSVEATKKWGEELNDLALKYAEERVQIESDYAKQIAELKAKGLTKEVTLAEAERDKKISAVTAGLIQETDLYKTATNDKLQASKETTEKLIADIKARIQAEVAAGKLSSETAKKMLEDINTAQTTVQDNNNKNNPFARLGSAFGENSKAQENLKAAKANPKTTTEDLIKLEDAAAKAQAKLIDAANAAVAGSQQIIGSVINGLSDLGMLTEDQKKTADEVVGMVSGAANLAIGIASGNPMQIIQGSVDLLVNGFKLFDSRTKNADKAIAISKNEVEKLKEAYTDLNDAIDKAFSTTKAKLIEQQMADLKNQNAEYEKMIAAEKSKKKPDADIIKQWEDAEKENNKTINDAKDKRIEAITGTDVMSAIDSFAQAYVNAWESGDDAAKKSTDLVKSLLKNSLVNYLKDQIQPDVNKFMTHLADYMIDGVLSAGEKAQLDADQAAIDAKAAANKKLLDPYLSDSTKSGVTGELQSQMTEGTGSQLVGLWSMTSMDIRWIKEWLAMTSGASPVTGNTDVSKILAETLNETHQINVNTKKSADNSDIIVESLEEIKRNTGSTSNRGSRA